MADELPPAIARLVADTTDFIRKFREAAAVAKETTSGMSDGVRDNTESIRDDFDSTGDSSENLGVRMGRAFNDMGMRIGNQFRRTFGDLREGMSDAESASDSADNAAQRASQTFVSMASQTGNVTGRLQLMSMAFAGLSGPVGGLLALGIPAIFGGIGIAAEKSNKQVDSAFTSMAASAKSTLASAFKPIVPALVGIARQIQSTVQSLAPAFSEAATAMAPILTSLAGGLLGAVKTLVSGLAPLVSSVMPVVQALGAGLNSVARGVVGLFRNLNMGEAAAGLKALLSAIGQLLPVVGRLIGALMPVGNAILSVVLPAVVKLVSTVGSALTPVLAAITPIMGPIAEVVAEVGQAFGALITAAAPLVAPFLQIVLALANLDTGLEAISPLFKTLADAIAPMLPVIAKIVNLVVTFANTALSSLARALQPVITSLGGELMTALKVVLAVLTPLVGGLTKMLPVLTPLIVDIGLMVGALKLMGAVMAVVNLIMDANPFVLLGIAVIAITALIVANWSKIKAFLSEVWDWITSTVSSVGHWFSHTWETTLNAVGGFFTRVGNDIRKAWDAVIRWFEGVGSKIKGALSGAASWLVGIGKAIIDGLWHGIENAASWLWGQIKGLGNKIVGAFKSVLNIFSPSRVMANEIGNPIMQGIAKGMADNLHHVVSAATNTRTAALAALKGSASIGLSVAGSVTGGVGAGGGLAGSGGTGVTINVQGSIMDTQGFFRALQAPALQYATANGANGLAATFRRPAGV